MRLAANVDGEPRGLSLRVGLDRAVSRQSLPNSPKLIPAAQDALSIIDVLFILQRAVRRNVIFARSLEAETVELFPNPGTLLLRKRRREIRWGLGDVILLFHV
jgi:hypothetical protein